MEKKAKFGAFVSDAGKAAKGLFDKSKDFAIQVMDQNDDGKFDLTDVSALAETMEDVVKKVPGQSWTVLRRNLASWS